MKYEAQSRKLWLAAALAGWFTVAIAQPPKPEPPSDIIVTGKRPHLDGGLWHFDRYPTRALIFPPPKKQMPGYQYDLCIPDGSLTQILSALLSSNPTNDPNALKCSIDTLDINTDRISGRSRCSRGNFGYDKTINGKIADTIVDVSLSWNTTHSSHRRDHHVRFISRLKANRTGACPI